MGVLIAAVFAGSLVGIFGSPVVLPQTARLVAPARTPTKTPPSDAVTVFDVVLAPPD
jgi:hypothetical protein